jgi:hypothetical protein
VLLNTAAHVPGALNESSPDYGRKYFTHHHAPSQTHLFVGRKNKKEDLGNRSTWCWWPQAEAMVDFFNAWKITGDKKWLDWSIGS